MTDSPRMFRFQMPARTWDVEAKTIQEAKDKYQMKFGYYPGAYPEIEISEIDFYE